MLRIKERNRRKAALQDRKSAATQARMKSIANLAADDRVSKKRRKGTGGALLRLHHASISGDIAQRTHLALMTPTGRSIGKL